MGCDAQSRGIFGRIFDAVRNKNQGELNYCKSLLQQDKSVLRKFYQQWASAEKEVAAQVQIGAPDLFPGINV